MKSFGIAKKNNSLVTKGLNKILMKTLQRFLSNYCMFMKIRRIMEEPVRIEKQLQLLNLRLNKLNLLKFEK